MRAVLRELVDCVEPNGSMSAPDEVMSSPVESIGSNVSLEAGRTSSEILEVARSDRFPRANAINSGLSAATAELVAKRSAFNTAPARLFVMKQLGADIMN